MKKRQGTNEADQGKHQRKRRVKWKMLVSESSERKKMTGIMKRTRREKNMLRERMKKLKDDGKEEYEKVEKRYVQMNKMD